MEFSRPEYWSGWPFPSLGDLPNPGVKPRSPALQADSLPAEPQGKPRNPGVGRLSLLQWIFPTQESNRGLLHCRQILYQLSHKGGLASKCQLLHPRFLLHTRMVTGLEHSLSSSIRSSRASSTMKTGVIHSRGCSPHCPPHYHSSSRSNGLSLLPVLRGFCPNLLALVSVPGAFHPSPDVKLHPSHFSSNGTHVQDAPEGIIFSSMTSVVSTVLVMTSLIVISGGYTRDG